MHYNTTQTRHMIMAKLRKFIPYVRLTCSKRLSTLNSNGLFFDNFHHHQLHSWLYFWKGFRADLYSKYFHHHTKHSHFVFNNLQSACETLSLQSLSVQLKIEALTRIVIAIYLLRTDIWTEILQKIIFWN